MSGLARRVASRPCLLAVAGLVVVLLDVRVGFFDLLPDALGFAGVAYALGRPGLGGPGTGPAPDARAARVAAVVGTCATVPDIVSVGWTYHHPGWSMNDFGTMLGIVATLAVAVLLYFLCRQVRRLAHGGGDLARYAEQWAWWVPFPLGVAALVSFVVLVGAQPVPDIVSALVSLGVYASFAATVVLLVWVDGGARTGSHGGHA